MWSKKFPAIGWQRSSTRMSHRVHLAPSTTLDWSSRIPFICGCRLQRLADEVSMTAGHIHQSTDARKVIGIEHRRSKLGADGAHPGVEVVVHLRHGGKALEGRLPIEVLNGGFTS